MATLTAVDYDPFAATKPKPPPPTPAAARGSPKLTPVDHDPFAAAAPTPKPANPASRYMSQAAFRTRMDEVYGAGHWRETSGYRTAAQEDSLRAQGAGMNRPGTVDPHMQGGPDDPGAYDIVVPGMNAQQAAQRLRDANFQAHQIYPEAAHGTQGEHLHIGMNPEGAAPKLTPVDHDPFAAPAPASAKPKLAPVNHDPFSGSVGVNAGPAPPKKPSLVDEAVSGVRNAAGDFADLPGSISRNVSAAERQFGRDATDPNTYRTPTVAGAPPKLVLDAMGVAYSPVQGALESVPGRVTERASGGRIKKETAANIIGAAAPFAGEVSEAAQASRLAREADIGETGARQALEAQRATRGAIRGRPVDHDPFAAEGPRPKGKPLAADHPARFEPEAISTDPTLRVGKPKKPKVGPPDMSTPRAEEARGPVVGAEKDPVERVDNALYRLGGHATADKIEAMQALRDVPPEIADPKVQEELTHAIEERMLRESRTKPPTPANDPRPLSRSEVLPDDRFVVFDTRKAKGVEGIFPSAEEAQAFIDKHPDGASLDYGSQRDVERWNPTGPDSPEYEDYSFRQRLKDALKEPEPPTDPTADLPDHLKAAEKVRQPWAERQRTAVNNIRKALKAKGLTDEEIEDYAPDSGYVPRRVVGKSPNLDPLDQGSKNPLAIGGKRPGLTKTTGSMKARDQIVFENENGERTFEHRNPTNDEWKPGTEVRHPVTGERGTVKQATIKEIEEAGAVDSKGKPLAYHKNALVNTIDEALKAERVERNLQVLDELTDHLKEQGLAHRTEWHYQNEAGEWVRAKANEPTPEGFKELPHIPQLKGWAFSPEVAEVLKDYYPEEGEPIDNVISTINRALNASLFVTPFPHIKNVGTMGFIGRGWDWIPGSGNYGRMMKSGAKAIKEVLTLGPKYREHLREGSGLMAGDDATRNFHEAMLNMAARGVMSAPEKAGRALGMNPVDAIKALYNVSHKILWNVNDMILFQRQLELEAKGMSKREAIKESEKWIANYRVPPQVFKSRAFQQFITDGKWINFGRYTYGKWKAIGNMIKDVATGTPEEKLDATGKIVAAGVATLFIYPMMNAMLQKATGNPNARVPMGGELAPVEAAQDFAKGEKDWASAMASFTTPAPLLETGLEAYNNRELYSGQNIVDPKASNVGKAVQAGEFGAGLFYPAELAMEATKPGGAEAAAGRFAGVSLPARKPGAMKGSTDHRLRGQARRRERNDPIESTVTRLMGNQ